MKIGGGDDELEDDAHVAGKTSTPMYKKEDWASLSLKERNDLFERATRTILANKL